MPELPEVETIRRYLNLSIVNERIQKLEVLWAGSVVKAEPADVYNLKNQKINSIARKGKYLLFQLEDFDMVVHLRMTGQIYLNPQNPLEDHIRWVLYLQNGDKLYYRDVRKFGRLFLALKSQGARLSGLDKLGPEPWEITLEYWQDKLKSNRSIKLLLLDQRVISGIGNIYADEALFLAKIHPETKGKDLSSKQAAELLVAVRTVLDLGMRFGGTSFRDYVSGDGKKGNMQEKLLVYQKDGQLCPRCTKHIEKIKVGGRSSHFCPICQLKPRR
ncbi:MAG TPA: DNA-formamidopyrimidine glycosylase [Firmicutes bacterium]|jgi:formamidopyrimidine-DNA glycosylase|nr:DNA-formamidopyrimidine glycosylase [Bacillota bacterium]